MAEQTKTPQPKRQTNPKVYDASTGPWKIEGYGRKPELKLRICITSILASEKDDYEKYVADCKAQGVKPDPQTKYPYIVDAVFTEWAELFEYAETSCTWHIGKLAREGKLDINATYDDTPGLKGDARFTRIKDAIVPEIAFPPVRQPRGPQKSMEQQFQAKPREEQLAFLTSQAKALGISLDDFKKMLAGD